MASFARVLSLSLCLGALAQAAPIFNLTLGGGITPGSPAHLGFQQAAAAWASLLADSVTVNLSINMASLGSTVLGSTSMSILSGSYATIRNGLVSDATSADDNTAVGNLQPAPALAVYTNTPPGAPALVTGSPINTQILLTRANARALGLWAAVDGNSDGSITFSSDYAWDFNPGDGITVGLFDFVAAATHEIGHALGIISGVDFLDGGNPAARVSVFDLFRYSAPSFALGAIDFTANSTDKYFSLDGGVTSLGQLAEGLTYGDGRQASHWKDDLGLGIFDPTLAPGELGTISALDLRGLDAIGWDSSVPEPSTLLLGAVGCVLILLRRRP